jgi:YidC/Oxa1 family membrane protein insertase
LEQQDLNKRLFLALVLSFLVFIGYGYFFPATQPVSDLNGTTHDVSAQTPAKKTPNRVSEPASNAKAAPVTEKTQRHLFDIVAPKFKMSFDELGRIEQFELLEEKYRDAEGHSIKILGKNVAKPLEVRFSDPALNEEAFRTPYVASVKGDVKLDNEPVTLTLSQKLSKATVTKKVTVHPSGAYDLNVKVDGDVAYFITPGIDRWPTIPTICSCAVR